MGRIEDLKVRFPIGSKVKVSSTDPRKLRGSVSILPQMHQFFCGEELKVVGHSVMGGQLALLLNTRDFGASYNYYFDVDWVSAVNTGKIPVQMAPVYRRRLGLDKDTNEVAAAVNAKLAHKRAVNEIRRNTKTLEETHSTEQIAQALKEDIFDEDTVEIPVPQPEVEQQSYEPSFAGVIGGALAMAFGKAMKDHLAKTKKPHEQQQTIDVAVEEPAAIQRQ